MISGWSPIGLGGWQLGVTAPADAREVLTTSGDLGVDWIDTAPVYAGGAAERVVAGERRFRVATKCGLAHDEGGDDVAVWSGAAITAQVDASRRRLGIDRIDLLQLHHPPQVVPIEDVWEVMARLVHDDLVAEIGLCNVDAALVERCRAVHPVASVQIGYSLLDRSIERELLDACGALSVPVLVYGVLAQGRLTSDFGLQQWPPGDWRRTAANLETFEAAARIRRLLDPVAAEAGVTLEQLCVGWALGHPHVSAAIVGVRNRTQLMQTIDLTAMRRAHDLRAAVNDRLATDQLQSIRTLPPAPPKNEA